MAGPLWRLLKGQCRHGVTFITRRGYASSSSGAILGGFIPESPKHVLHCMFTRNNTILTLCRRVPRSVKSTGADAKSVSPLQSHGFGHTDLVLDQEAMIDAVRPQQEVIATVTTGQLGFRGTKKSSYDAAFQTATKMFSLMEKKSLLGEEIELVLRNFGQNREAFLKVLLGKEGTRVRPLVKRITDATQIKFGGDRSPNKRRV